MDLRALYWKQRADGKGAYMGDLIVKRLLNRFQGQYRIKYVCRGCGHLVKGLSNNGRGWNCIDCNKTSTVEEWCVAHRQYYLGSCHLCRQEQLLESREATNISKWNFAG